MLSTVLWNKKKDYKWILTRRTIVTTYTIFNKDELELMKQTLLMTKDIIKTWMEIKKTRLCPFEDLIYTIHWDKRCFEILDEQNEFYQNKATEKEKIKRLEEFWISGVPIKNICNELCMTANEIEKAVEENHLDIKCERNFKEIKVGKNSILSSLEIEQIINYSKQPKVKKIDCIKFVKDNFNKKVHINTIYSILKK